MKGSAGTGSGGSTPKQPFKVRRFFFNNHDGFPQGHY